LTADVESLLRRLRGRRAVKTPKKMFKPPLPGVMSRSGMRDASEWRGKIMGRLLEEWLREKSKLLKP